MASDLVRSSEVDLTLGDRGRNVLRALVKLVPGAGGAIDQLVFGPSQELREKRVEATLAQIVARLESEGKQAARAEEYVNLLERALPRVARATSEQARQFLRDLLVNAATLPSGDEAWAEASLAERLLADLDPPALSILAQLARYDGPTPAALVSRPYCQIVPETDLDWSDPPEGRFRVGYNWILIEEWARRLRAQRLITYGSHNGADGGFGGIELDELGELLVRWAVAE